MDVTFWTTLYIGGLFRMAAICIQTMQQLQNTKYEQIIQKSRFTILTKKSIY